MECFILKVKMASKQLCLNITIKKKVSHRGTVIEVSGKEFIEDSSQDKCKGCENSFKIKAGL